MSGTLNDAEQCLPSAQPAAIFFRTRYRQKARIGAVFL
jgi:hypothetical protein